MMHGDRDQDASRELDFYRRQCDEMGSRILRLQQAQERAHVEARRCRAVACLVRETIRISDRAGDVPEIGERLLNILVRASMYERGAVLRHDPATGSFEVVSACGFAESPCIPAMASPPECLVVNSATARDAATEAIGRALDAPFFVWAMNPASGYAVVLGNRSEVGLFGALDAGEHEIADAALNVFCDAVHRKEAERAVHEANVHLELRVEERTRELLAEINERRQAEKALAASEARLRGAVESLEEGFALFDSDDHLVLANAAYRDFNPSASIRPGTRGLRFEDLLRVSVESGRFPEATGREEGFIQERLRSHRDPRGPIICNISGGRRLLIREWRTPDGGIALAFVDLTDLVRAQEETRRLQSEVAHVSRLNTIGEMAAGFAHEINQPLAAINSYAQGCVRRIQSDRVRLDDLLPVLVRISEQAERAGEINRRIRRFLQKEELNRTPTDLNAGIDSAVRLLAGLASEHEVDIALDLDKSLPRVMADALHIQQVVLNLMRNGIEAMDEGGDGPRRVTIRTLTVGRETVRVEIADTGRGISRDVEARLFEPFFSTKAGGMGMGLLVCQRIVKAHGGALSIGTNGQRGTLATFTLPRADSEAAVS